MSVTIKHDDILSVMRAVDEKIHKTSASIMNCYMSGDYDLAANLADEMAPMIRVIRDCAEQRGNN